MLRAPPRPDFRRRGRIRSGHEQHRESRTSGRSREDSLTPLAAMLVAALALRPARQPNSDQQAGLAGAAAHPAASRLRLLTWETACFRDRNSTELTPQARGTLDKQRSGSAL